MAQQLNKQNFDTKKVSTRAFLYSTSRSVFFSTRMKNAKCKWATLKLMRRSYFYALACSAAFLSCKFYIDGTEPGKYCPNNKQVVTFAEIGNYGRLGNQLFQIAATVGIAEYSGASWALPTSVSNSTIGRLFDLKGEISLYQRFTELPEATQLYHDVKIPQSACYVSLRGYYQSLKYFENSHATLRKHFRIPAQLMQHVRTEVKEINAAGTVALHVRRGDYTEPPFNTLYNLMPVDYYIDALSRFKNVTHIIIVTNDRLWCQRHLAGHLDAPVVFSPFEDEVLDFVLLYLAKRIIIANSSFSWWAAFLRLLHRLPYQVMAPRHWYKLDGGLAYLNNNYFFPETWVQLSV